MQDLLEIHSRTGYWAVMIDFGGFIGCGGREARGGPGYTQYSNTVLGRFAGFS